MGLFNFFKPRSVSESDRLFLIAKNGIVEIKKNYKGLSYKGKFEAILFNSLTVLNVYRENYPSKYANIEEEYLKLLCKQAKKYGIYKNSEQIMDFIENRFQFYTQEMENLKIGRGYIPGKIYTAFYLTPLVINPGQSYDLIEIANFMFGLKIMRNWVHKNSNKI